MMREPFKWRQLVALARVTASAYGYDRFDNRVIVHPDTPMPVVYLMLTPEICHAVNLEASVPPSKRVESINCEC